MKRVEEPRWQVLTPDPAAVARLAKSLKCHPVTAKVLVNRRIVNRPDACRFMEAPMSGIRAPFAIRDMDAAVERIDAAIRKKEKILVFGDYDVDGVTATTLLAEFLESVGGDVRRYIPHRIREGYGLQVEHIENPAVARGIGLIVTVDCGASSHDAVAEARKAGIDVIVTDHHTLSGDPPDALAVVNPRRSDCCAGLGDLAGVGVAFYLVIALRKHLRDRGFWSNGAEPNLKAFCDLVALGTVADVVPLTAENRIFSRAGLERMVCSDRPGICALMSVAGLGDRPIAAEDIAFRLGPRINAAGRMDHAGLALELMTTDDPDRAMEIARELNRLNGERQAVERRMLDEILNHLRLHPHLLEGRSIVLSSEKWHEGVLGIVAAKVARLHYRPVLLIGVRDGVGKGSGRSIPGVDLHAGLAACAGDLERFGGHAMAAGLTIRPDKIPGFRDRFDAAVREMSTDDDFTPVLTLDAELPLSDISDVLLDELASLNPYGEGNPEPLFMARGVRVRFSKIVGGRHRKMTLCAESDPSGKPVQAIQFNVDPDGPLPGRFGKMAFRAGWNVYNGRKTPQVTVEVASPENDL